MPNGGMIPASKYTVGDSSREIRWPAIRKPPLSRSIASDSARAAAPPAISSMRRPIRAALSRPNLARPNGVLLEVPGLLSTPALGKAVFDYQFEVKQARDAAAKSATPASEAAPVQPATDAKAQRRSLSPDTVTMEMSGKAPAMEAPEKGGANAAMQSADAMQPDAPKPPPQPLNIIQKTYRAEALARLQRAMIADCGFARAAGGVLVQPFLHLRQQGRTGADVGRLVRARGDPAPCARALRRHAQGGRAASGDAVLSRQSAIAGPGFPRRAKPQARTERKSRARNHGTAHARRRRRLFPGRRDLAGAHHHRLDLCRTARTTRRARQFRVQRQCASAGRAAPARQDL